MYEIVVGRSDADRKALGIQGSVFLGKHYVKMGNTTSLSSKIFLDVARTHVVLVSGKRGCLTSNTNVLTDTGYKNIKDFDKLKDSILTFDKKTKEFRYSNAALIKYKVDEELFNITFEDNSNIETTTEHPLLILENKNFLWRETKDLSVGDLIISKEENSKKIIQKKIKSILKINGINEVYDLTVPITHSFIANGIISHNSGKSYSLGVVAEEMAHLPEEIKNKIAVLMIDTMGIFWTMRFPNVKDEDLLEEWQLPKKPLDISIYTPAGYFQQYKEKGIPTDFPFTISPSELSAYDWCNAFDIKLSEPIGVAIESVIAKIKEEKENYSVENIIKEIEENNKIETNTKLAAINRFIAAKSWGVFSEESTPLREIVAGGKVSVLDISAYKEWGVKTLVTGILCKKLMEERTIARKKEEMEDVKKGHSYFETTLETTGEELPLVWILIDEAHSFIPKDKTTAATDALVHILREGRQPGISLILATQQPGEIHTDVITQTDIVLSHRITAKRDVEALNAMMQTYLPGAIQKYFDMLPRMRGSALILDDNSERIYPLQIRPRFTWHGGEAPTALKAKGKAAAELGL